MKQWQLQFFYLTSADGSRKRAQIKIDTKESSGISIYKQASLYLAVFDFSKGTDLITERSLLS